MSSRIKTVAGVVDWRLCLGCGACAFICPEKKISLFDFLEEGIRPILANESCSNCTACLDVCPAYENDHSEINSRPGCIAELKDSCGPVLEVWEGHAADPEIRFLGSSGGLITALSLFCLEKQGMHGVLHIGGDPENPLRNKTKMSRSRGELLGQTGSRYAPASACDRLDLIESAPSPCVFVGQPSEVTALRKAERLRSQLREKVGLTISFFCAGSPSTQGTLELLKSKGVDPSQVKELRYRGKGWPGHFAPTLKGHDAAAFQMTYKESWGFVQAYRPFSVHLCPDGTGEDADISCGDPWYREVQNGEAGSSLVVVRTERGREIIRAAIAAGYFSLQPAPPQRVLDSQRNLLAKRGAIWGRVAALRALGLPAPELHGFELFKNWRRLSLNDKLRSTFGTLRRILARKYYRPLKLKPTSVISPVADASDSARSLPSSRLAAEHQEPAQKN
jgi:coenzyme F420 hydrogenase subunit beta